MKTRLFLLFLSLMLLSGRYCLAQAQPPFKAGTDTAAITRLIKAAHTTANPDSSIPKFLEAARLSVAGNYATGAATALIAAGSRYSDMGKFEEATKCAQQALPYSLKMESKSQAGFCYNLFGVIHFLQGNYVRASEEYYKALDVLKTTDSNSTRAAVTVYTNLANVNGRLKQNAKRLYYINQAEAMSRKMRIPPATGNILLAGILINKGNYYLETQPDSAVICYMEVVDITNKMDEKNSKRTRFEVLAAVNLGGAYLQAKDYEKAVTYCRQGIALAKNKFAYMSIAAAYTLGSALQHQKKYKEAEDVVLTALREGAAANIKDQAELGYKTLTDIYRETNQYEKALSYMDTLIALKDTTTTTEKTKAIKQVETAYEVARKDKQIIEGELLAAKQNHKIAEKNLLIAGISLAVLILSVLLTALYRSSKQRQGAIITSLKQENTISILKGVVQGEENERIRLARDLHDGIGGMLSATKMRFMALRHENETLVHSPRYLEAMGLLDVMGDEIRKTSHNLMPEVLLKQDLAEALRIYCNNIQEGTSMQLEFQSFGSFDGLANDFKLNIYRIVQELLKNVLQHADATYTVVQLMMLTDYLTISVEDNGKGFDTSQTKDGIGLHNLKTRVLSHEGHYTLKSDKGKGTTVYIEFMIQKQA